MVDRVVDYIGLRDNVEMWTINPVGLSAFHDRFDDLLQLARQLDHSTLVFSDGKIRPIQLRPSLQFVSDGAQGPARGLGLHRSVFKVEKRLDHRVSTSRVPAQKCGEL